MNNRIRSSSKKLNLKRKKSVSKSSRDSLSLSNTKPVNDKKKKNFNKINEHNTDKSLKLSKKENRVNQEEEYSAEQNHSKNTYNERSLDSTITQNNLNRNKSKIYVNKLKLIESIKKIIDDDEEISSIKAKSIKQDDNKSFTSSVSKYSFIKSASIIKNKREKITKINDITENAELIGSNTIIENKFDLTEKLTNSTIYCRDKEKETIVNFINSNDKICKTIFVCGQPGTGKTSTILEIFENLKIDNTTFFKMYLNCMSVHSIEDFYSEFFKFFNKIENLHEIKNIVTKKEFLKISEILKLSPNKKNMWEFLENLDVYKEKIKPLILLDEVDYFYLKNNEILFYDILNIPHVTSGALKILMISNNSEFDKEILPKIKNRKIKIEKCVFEPYTHIEINKILIKKLEEIGMTKNFEENAIRFISSKLANKSGDLRPALELIKKIILDNKEEFNKGKRINLTDVMSVLKYQLSYFVEIIRNLTFEQKLVVISIYFILNKEDSFELEETEILNQYKILKREYFTDDVNITDFREIIKSLCDIGIMEEKAKTPMKSRARFKIKPKMEELQILFGEEEKLFSIFQPIIMNKN